MTHEEIIADGVEIIYSGRPSYMIPCEVCGRKIRRTQYSRKRTYLCDYCKGVMVEKKKVELSGTRTKYDKRFDSAVEKMQKAVSNIDVYSKAILAAKTRAYSYGSIPEAMAAIELLKNKYRIIPQQKIGKYKVDFVLPDIKVILEIDGEIYHTDITKEGTRDFYLTRKMGFDWRIVHMPSRYILKDITKLKTFIETYKTFD